MTSFVVRRSTPTPDLPGLWLLLHEAPFTGQWIGLSDDWAEHLPCSDEVLSSWLEPVKITVVTGSALGRAINDELRADLRRHGHHWAGKAT